MYSNISQIYELVIYNTVDNTLIWFSLSPKNRRQWRGIWFTNIFHWKLLNLNFMITELKEKKQNLISNSSSSGSEAEQS